VSLAHGDEWDGITIHRMSVPCKDCGMTGAHFCPGKRPEKAAILDKIQLDEDLRALKALFTPPKCKKHRQYKAMRRPRTACEACWRQWIAKNP